MIELESPEQAVVAPDLLVNACRQNPFGCKSRRIRYEIRNAWRRRAIEARQIQALTIFVAGQCRCATCAFCVRYRLSIV